MSLFAIAYEYLRACCVPISKEFFEKKLRSHPNYPALASLTDTLDELELEEGYVALKGTSLRMLFNSSDTNHAFRNGTAKCYGLWPLPA